MNFNNFTIKSQEAVQKAVEITSANGQQAIEPVHLLKGVVDVGESLVNYIFQKLGVNVNLLKTAVDREIASLPKVSVVKQMRYCRKLLTTLLKWEISLLL